MKKIDIENLHGICRTVDELGRLGFPKELREHLDIHARDLVEMIPGEDYIILKKHRDSCVFCHARQGEMTLFRGKLLCPTCLSQLKGELPLPEEVEDGE